MGVRDIPDFKLNEGAGPSAALVFVRASGKPLTDGVPAMFTQRGYAKSYHGTAKTLVPQLVEEEAWVLGPQASGGGGLKAVPKVMEDVQRLYLNEYIQAWDSMLKDVRLKPTTDLPSSIQVMTLLSAGDSPLRQLLQAVTKETKLATGAAQNAEQAAAKLADRAASAVRERIDGLLGDRNASANAGVMKPEAMVERHFDQIHRMVAGNPAPLDAVLNVLKEYEVFLRGNQEAVARGTAPQSDALIKAKIKGEADRMAPPVGPMLNALVSSSGGQAAREVAAGVEKQVGGQVGASCKTSIEGRYPFTKGSSREVPLTDFATLFKPGGTIDSLVKGNLASVLDTSGPVWKPVKADGVAQMDEATAANLQRAAIIRDAFFPAGSADPRVQADLVLTKVEDGVGEIHVQVDGGQLTKMIPGANQGVRVTWPSNVPSPQIRMAVRLANQTDGPSASFDGPWALFRLVDAARQEGGTSDRMLLGVMIGDRKATFELRTGTARNPLRLPELAQFRCPG
jgi:type VI secretion system protein ImpL